MNIIWNYGNCLNTFLFGGWWWGVSAFPTAVMCSRLKHLLSSTWCCLFESYHQRSKTHLQDDLVLSPMKNRESLLIYSTVDPTNNTKFNFLSSDTHLAQWLCLTQLLWLISSSWKRIAHLIIAVNRMWPLHLVSDLCLEKNLKNRRKKYGFCSESYKWKTKCILICIYRLSVHLGRGIPPMWLFLSSLPFFSLKGLLYEVFLIQIKC